MGENDERPPVGSVAEEAAALFAALSGLAKEQGGQYAGAAAAAAADAAHGINEHIANGSAECQWCPVCQVIHAVRSTSPEVKAHLSVAAHSLLRAASSVLATYAPQTEQSPVEKIDLDDESN